MTTLIVTMKLHDAAFDDPEQEERVLRGIAVDARSWLHNRVTMGPRQADGASYRPDGSIRDVNGNRVGVWTIDPDVDHDSEGRVVRGEDDGEAVWAHGVRLVRRERAAKRRKGWSRGGLVR